MVPSIIGNAMRLNKRKQYLNISAKHVIVSGNAKTYHLTRKLDLSKCLLLVYMLRKVTTKC